MGSSADAPRSRFLALPRLDSIRNRIVLFAILATLVPSGITMGLSYAQSRRALEAKITQDLLSESGQSARAIGVWLKERLYDLRVFASSEEVGNNLGRLPRDRERGGLPNRKRLGDYLASIHERFKDFDQLMALDLRGNVLATSSGRPTSVRLPADWVKALRSQSQLVGDAYWDANTGKGKLIVAVPVKSTDGQLIGAFAAEINLAPLKGLLREFAHDSSGGGSIRLMTSNGALIASSEEISARLIATTLSPVALERLTRREQAVVPLVDRRGHEVVGTLERVPQVAWAVVAEVSADAAFRQVRHFRDMALVIMTLLLIAVAASGYRFGLLIVRPLDRLTGGAIEVAAGDLAVDLPEAGGGEVGALTTVFNHMVSRLREGRRELDVINATLRSKNEELERLSVTDGLTGLVNHRFLMQRLKDEGVRSYRNNREFSVLMADVDHFKEFNDAFGHPEGDEVLKKIAAILREATRAMDCVARYGGEEFAVVMPETTAEGALQLAERIRARVAEQKFHGEQITLSIGVAEYPKDADVPQAIIAVADAALYAAKKKGRDRVVQGRRSAKATT
ncbi:MAG: sensor domain-containing diguanylate cyclase [Gemmatimonadaceae bacterium]